MTSEEAIALIISEVSESGESLLMTVRRGEDPGSERMRRLNLALHIVFQSLENHPELERDLAAALFTLGSDVPLTISSLAGRGHSWRRGFMEDEVYQLLMGVQSIFEDRWLESEQPEIIH
ncbi:MAG: hypothetical protein QOH63_3327 [Acidobacteriota bacterium]|jgi:hypothetical protein|nr:hypothetical protein [Acidobacteriota bacterium]